MNDKIVRGFKVFNKDWTCSVRGNKKQYSCPGKFEEDVELCVSRRGMHFCKKVVDCFKYYEIMPENHVAEVLAYGNVLEHGDKCCTDKLEIVREITWQEVLEIVNTGKDCTGLCNTGNSNSGNYNSGNRNSGSSNSGSSNSGNYNSGNRNSGNSNSGNRNSGNRNSGNWNSGNYNSGNWNSGDYNKTNFSNGCFNTEEPKIYLFNKPSDWTYRNWINSDAKYLLNQIQVDDMKWIVSNDMTEEEKAKYPEHETTGGYLKVLDKSKHRQIWWDELTEMNRNIIRALPNFDAEIFRQITGINVE